MKVKTVARNVFWNWAGKIAEMLAGFVVAPFLVNHLGNTLYGLWIVIGALGGYFGLMDLGIRVSMGRHIAFHRAKGDQAGVNTVFSTALAYLSSAAMLALVATLGFAAFFCKWFDIPEDQEANARLAVLILGVNFALMLPLSLFDAALAAFHRFDLMNAVDIPCVLFRMGATIFLVSRGNGLVALAVITLVTNLTGAGLRAVLSFREDPELRASRTLIRLATAKVLFGFSLWYFLLSFARNLTPMLTPMLIGWRLGLTLVTPFSIASRLIAYASQLILAGTQVLTPLATALHAEEKHEQQRRLILEGSKYCLALSLGVVTVFWFLGRPLVVLWIGPGQEFAATLLKILVIGEAVPMAQWITYSIILGMGRHRTLALLSLLENAVAIPLALLLAEDYGLVGVCFAFAVPGAVFRGACQLEYACRLADIPVGRYLVSSVLPAVLAATVPAEGLALATSWHEPRTWPELIAYGAVFGVCYLGCASLLAGSPRAWARRVRVYRGPRVAVPAEGALTQQVS